MTNHKLNFRRPGVNRASANQGSQFGSSFYPPVFPGHGGGTLGHIGHGGGTLGYYGHDRETTSHSGLFPGASVQTTQHFRGMRQSDERVITLGYLPEFPDFRDYSVTRLQNDEIDLHGALKLPGKRKTSYLHGNARGSLPRAVDLRDTNGSGVNYFSKVENQGELGSCTANAVIGMIEYLIRLQASTNIELSRLFLYKVTRNLMDVTGDYGAYIRTTIKALKLFGCPPANRWPYDIETFDNEPNAFLYAMASNFKAMKYLRLDDHREPGDKVLEDLRRCIADGYPAAFGFPVYSSINDVEESNGYIIPYPTESDEFEGGHAVLAIGYDQERELILIRNSWGEDWGYEGHAWMPYDYVLMGLARDFWTVMSTCWVDVDQFEPA